MIVYRPDIDGLRAVAILPVILFHAGFDVVRGGFVGVDVFFVISGYLITALIFKEREVGVFSLVQFYERRARRILPALFFVIFCCLPLGWFWLLPNDLHLLADSMIAVVLFVSNVHFYKETGYFAPDAELQPLLHTWSLSIEEQFYLLFPLLIIAFWRRGRRFLGWLIASIAALSLLIAQFGGHLSDLGALIAGEAPFTSLPDYGFYLLPTRAWELLIGALIAWYLSSREGHREGNDILALLGLASIIYAVLAFDDLTPHPSIHTLLPVAGSALIILFATPKTICARLLSMPPLVGIGLISYSVYLWHQPVFAFFRIQGPDTTSPLIFFMLTLLSLGLGWLTWRFVERPFRDLKRFSRRQVFRYSALGAGVILSVGLSGIIFEGFINRYPDDVRSLVAATDKKQMGRYVYVRHKALEGKPFADDGRRKVLIVGDSFSQDFANMLVESGELDHISLSVHEIAAACGNLYLDVDFLDKIKAKDRAKCLRAGWYEGRGIQDNLREADAVLLVSAWSPWVAKLLPKSVEKLRDEVTGELLLIGGKFFGDIDPKDYLALTDDEKRSLREPITGTLIDTIRMMAEQYDDKIYVDVAKLFCGSYRDCPVFTPDLELISYDGSHLTREGAAYLGKRLRQHPLIRDALDLDKAHLAGREG